MKNYRLDTRMVCPPRWLLPQLTTHYPLPTTQVTLITRDAETPYSGMLPGYVAGLYTRAECHIDLAKLCAWAGCRMVHAEVRTGVACQAVRVGWLLHVGAVGEGAGGGREGTGDGGDGAGGGREGTGDGRDGAGGGGDSAQEVTAMALVV